MINKIVKIMQKIIRKIMQKDKMRNKMRSDATMKFEIYEIENDKENSGENIRNNKVDNIS